VSAHHLQSGPASPVLEDLHRFPSESLHSFSFARQSEDFLHSRQNILKKSVDFMRDKIGWAGNPGLASAQARASGDAELQGMLDLLLKAKVLGVDTSDDKLKGLGIGPLTGPADVQNPFEKSFCLPIEGVEEARSSLLLEGDSIGEQEVSERRPTTPPLEAGQSRDVFDSPLALQKPGLKRTYTDLASISLELKLMEALAQPYTDGEQSAAHSLLGPGIMPVVTTVSREAGPSSVHSHSKWSPASQAVFRTDMVAPWTIIAANDLACLIFGVTRAEVRKLGILEVVQEDRRPWLEDKLRAPDPVSEPKPIPSMSLAVNGKNPLVGARGGITAKLLSKKPSHTNGSPRAQTVDGSGGSYNPKKEKNHPHTKSRGVLLCGDVVPIQKRNGSTGAASFWVMEKRGGLIWVIEEITEDVAYLKLDKDGHVVQAKGDIEPIWSREKIETGTSITSLLPRVPVEFVTGSTTSCLHSISQVRHYTASTSQGINIPASISKLSGSDDLRVSSFPHIAGVMVLDPATLMISSSNAVFSAALFGYEHPEGLSIGSLIPGFEKLLQVLSDEEHYDLVDGIVIPEHSFRRVRALLALREGNENATSIFLRPSGLPAKHRDGSDIMVDVQMRVVRTETVFPAPRDDSILEKDEESTAIAVVYALWITYSRQLHSIGLGTPNPDHPLISRPITPPHQPPPPQTIPSPEPVFSDDSEKPAVSSQLTLLTKQLVEADPTQPTEEPLEHPPPHILKTASKKKTIDDFIILEEMGSGAYGQVKLARYRLKDSRKMVLKYVTKKRILVDTWTRDRRLGTVPLEIHVMDYLRREDLRHPNIVEMVDFFEDDINYYIEMLPHGIPGMDLFDYIELRSSMEESECRNIFKQVVDAIRHLHTKAFVVHRDIKDENVVLDGEGRVKLIDFGSATYIKNGPFDVFVGTIGKDQISSPVSLTLTAARLCCARSVARQAVWRY
jgi:protein-serine/threonine kinase